MPNKEDYLNDPDSTPIPWLSSPFVDQLIVASDLSNEDIFYCETFARDGYIRVDLDLDDEFIQGIKNDMARFEIEDYIEHFYDKDADHKRFFDLWRQSRNVCDLARHPKVLKTLDLLYRRKAHPFQTINFKAASEQAAHSDSIHFASIPSRWVAGVVVLLEDVDKNNGPFFLYPGSHKLPTYELNDAGLYDNDADNAKRIYRQYEEFIAAVIYSQGLSRYDVCALAGTAIIFDSNIIHGGAKVLDKSTTRFSQVTHYFFEGCNKYYCPLFSDTHSLEFADKNLANKYILGHKFDEEV